MQWLRWMLPSLLKCEPDSRLEEHRYRMMMGRAAGFCNRDWCGDTQAAFNANFRVRERPQRIGCLQMVVVNAVHGNKAQVHQVEAPGHGLKALYI